jgi:hypothetical protein
MISETRASRGFFVFAGSGVCLTKGSLHDALILSLRHFV